MEDLEVEEKKKKVNIKYFFYFSKKTMSFHKENGKDIQFYPDR